jgi:hypothetical protein
VGHVQNPRAFVGPNDDHTCVKPVQIINYISNKRFFGTKLLYGLVQLFWIITANLRIIFYDFYVLHPVLYYVLKV